MSLTFGVVFPQTELSHDPSALPAIARATEDLGFDSLLFYDHVVGAEERVRVARALAAPGVDGRMIEIDGAGHAFFWPGAPAFDEAARDRAWAEALTELRAPYSPG